MTAGPILCLVPMKPLASANGACDASSTPDHGPRSPS